ncbi:semaphorin-1A-like isoform X2 [Gigantopelta aegis]|uniref:semaphorin-1A-like isoform X2 n=1 Tax=Gigantopelta aegis TaxID=1735272 RepID=UPI001B888C30|nr:semaphorin-1A-like isoform X2 [Gigantopelta aegis]
MEYKNVDLRLRTGILLVLLLVYLSTCVLAWNFDNLPNEKVHISVSDSSVQHLAGDERDNDHFKLLLTEGTSMLVGAKNAIYNISLMDLEVLSKIDWFPERNTVNTCKRKQKTEEQCQNFIRVLVRKNARTLYACGTNAFRPRCRNYKMQENGDYGEPRDEDGVGQCPFDPEHNSTAIYANNNLYAATVTDFSARDPLIYESNHQLRTQQFDSKWLNEPNFVSSFEKGDRIYFFFRETAVENINCGKAVFSRVARVCKSDRGGAFDHYNSWTSFFKARLNCSIPGEFPFYFDELQATSDFGQGKFMPTFRSNDRSDMVYGIFTTPQNSIRASAVCAFRYSDITKVFESRFKGQETVKHNWLPVPKKLTPKPHPQTCTNNSHDMSGETLNFVKAHPLMDEAVPTQGGAPLLIQSSFSSQFTQIAIDWQVHGVSNYHDVMFIGTDDGRVIKAVNKATSAKRSIDTVIIEDIQVFEDRQPIVNMKVFRRNGMEKLVVMSKKDIVSIPLHRCHEKKSCRACVRLQDPYCSWADGECSNTDRGVQDIDSGTGDAVCGDTLVIEEKPLTATTTTPLPVQSEKCVCPTVAPPVEGPQELPNNVKNEPAVGEQKTLMASDFGSAETLAIAVVVSIVLSIIVGFLIGYKVSQCRASRDIDSPFHERNISLSKRSNRMSSGDHTYFVTDHAPKTVNYFVNMKSPGKLNSEMETKHVTKSNKVYL